MTPEWITKLGTGEAQAYLAEAWFKFLGFILIIAVFHAAAESSDIPILQVVKWASYLALWRWTMYKVDSFVWVLFPRLNPEQNKKISDRALFWSVLLSTNFAFYAYILALAVVDVINEL